MSILKKWFDSDNQKMALADKIIEVKYPTTEKVDAPIKKTIVEQIHYEFNNESDAAIMEAKKILSGLPAINSNHEMLSEIGFINVPEVINHKHHQELKEKNRLLAETILYYQQTYPTYKFITEGGVTKICKKYGLAWGEIRFYIGTVPDKNVKEIHQFHTVNPVKEIDLSYRLWVGDSYKELSQEEYKKKYAELQDCRTPYGFLDKDIRYKICAPPKYMDLRYSKIDENTREIIPEDPIVLFPVRKGYIIVSAWGDEAKDESIVNEKNN